MSQLSERYASALYDVTKEKGNTQEVLEVLVELRQSLTENKGLLEIFNSPLMSDTEKQDVLKTAVGAGLNDELSTFFDLLTKNNRITEIPSIAKAFEEKVAGDLGVEKGTVCSAVELSDSEKTNVQKLIEEKLGKKVTLSYAVDEKMIGGIEAKVGSYIFEDSIKTHMQKLNDFITRRVQ